MNNPIISIQDNFFDDFEATKTRLWECEFKDIQLEQDGIIYPYICEKLPKHIEYEFLYKVERAVGARIAPRFLFARAMPEGCKAPGRIHSDRDMGTYTAHIAFNGKNASTTFLYHPELGYAADAYTKQSQIDASLTRFQPYLVAMHKPNRLIAHHASHFHCAEPEMGFGILKKDARLVITCFFDVT